MSEIDHFYASFEDKYRGSRDLILQRLSVYEPVLQAIAGACEEPPRALDLGCGRGEWLEVLAQHSFNALGVDLSHDMVERCTARGLSAYEGDAFKALSDYTDNSLDVISAFHLIEHVPFDGLYDMLKEARRALKPDGVLLLETPNPEAILVGAYSFYLDPTHRNPIPPLLLRHLCEYVGFNLVEVVRHNQIWDGQQIKFSQARFTEFVNGYPDYAVIGLNGEHSAMNDDVLAAVRAICEPARGDISGVIDHIDRVISTSMEDHRELLGLERKIETIIGNHVEQIEYISKLHAEKTELHEKLNASKCAEHQRNVNAYEKKVGELTDAMLYWQQETELRQAMLDALHSNYRSVVNSRSWKITKPFRLVGVLLRSIRGIPKRTLRLLLGSKVLRAIGKKLLPSQRLREKLRAYSMDEGHTGDVPNQDIGRASGFTREAVIAQQLVAIKGRGNEKPE